MLAHEIPQGGKNSFTQRSPKHLEEGSSGGGVGSYFEGGKGRGEEKLFLWA